VLLLGLSTGHKVGLALAAAGFAGFSLIASMLVPRWRPQFPGRGLWVFVVVCVLLFVGMMTAVVIFGRESGGEAEAAGHEATTAPTQAKPKPAGQTVQVSESEWKIKLPKTSFAPGTYTFDVSNDGKVEHDLTIEGGGVKKATPNISGGKSAKLTVDLKQGTYDFYCAVAGHKQLGMDEKVTIS
jgi:uncharacterized cupredoxin-like copper-binding protein